MVLVALTLLAAAAAAVMAAAVPKLLLLAAASAVVPVVDPLAAADLAVATAAALVAASAAAAVPVVDPLAAADLATAVAAATATAEPRAISSRLVARLPKSKVVHLPIRTRSSSRLRRPLVAMPDTKTRSLPGPVLVLSARCSCTTCVVSPTSPCRLA